MSTAHFVGRGGAMSGSLSTPPATNGPGDYGAELPDPNGTIGCACGVRLVKAKGG